LRLEGNKLASKNNVLSSGPSVSLPVRSSRPCHALAFCTADPNYLAVGLDKVRGDCSLVIWDIQSASPSLSLSPSHPQIDGSAPLPSRPQPRIPRADIGPRTDARVIQQHAPAEIVSPLAFLPQSTSLLLAGISYRWLRLFDLRSASPSTTNVAARVQGIATDPFDLHRIACFGDGIVTIWDARSLTNSLLTFSEKDARADGARSRQGASSLYTTVEFSNTRRGMLGTLEKDTTYVRFWDLAQTQPWDGSSDGERSRDSSQSRAPKMSWANLSWTTGSSSQQSRLSRKNSDSHSSEYSLVLSDTRKSETSSLGCHDIFFKLLMPVF
jgi:hypothetical protein